MISTLASFDVGGGRCNLEGPPSGDRRVRPKSGSFGMPDGTETVSCRPARTAGSVQTYSFDDEHVKSDAKSQDGDVNGILSVPRVNPKMAYGMILVVKCFNRGFYPQSV